MRNVGKHSRYTVSSKSHECADSGGAASLDGHGMVRRKEDRANPDMQLLQMPLHQANMINSVGKDLQNEWKPLIAAATMDDAQLTEKLKSVDRASRVSAMLPTLASML